MSTFLYKVGKSAYNKPWYFLISWIVILGIVLFTLQINGIHTSSEMKIEGTESQKVLDQLAKELPEASGGQASVLFQAPKGESLDTPERLAAISKVVNKVYQLDYVVNPAKLAAQMKASPIQNTKNQESSAAKAPYGPLVINGIPVPGVMISSNGNIALFQFQFTVQQTSLPKSVTDAVIKTVTDVSGTGITVLPSDSLKSGNNIEFGSGEIIGLVVAAIVLLLTLGSVVAASLPLLTAFLGVGISVGGAFAISNSISMVEITPVLALMIGLAVGIDYSLFIVNRQRRMILDQGLTAGEAASRAVGTAGSAVFFAGLTVIIALCGMVVIGIEFLSTMALVAAVSVLVNVIIALTLLPALLGLIGERICSKKTREKIKLKKSSEHNGFAHRWSKSVVKYRWVVVLGVIAVLGISAIPVSKMETAIPSGATANLDTPARQSYDAISSGFGEGFNGPLVLVAESVSPSPMTPERLYGLVQSLQKQKNVSVVTPMGVNKDGSKAVISVIPKSGPTDLETKNLVQDLRNSKSSLTSTFDVKIGVTGMTAINIDMSSKLSEVFPIYIGIIVILSLIILLLVFRSFLVPIKATIGFLLSVLATFGLTTAVFQWGYVRSLFDFDTGGPLLSFMPIMVTGILYGLAMDYQVFLVSSMRESYIHGHSGHKSVIHGFDLTSRVVVAAAVIMVSVFAGFIFTDDIMIKQIGFALALGILIDAFIVRMTLIPAVMAIFGDKAWWLPKWMDRILPNLDVEGDKLISKLQAKEK